MKYAIQVHDVHWSKIQFILTSYLSYEHLHFVKPQNFIGMIIVMNLFGNARILLFYSDLY